MVRAIADDLVVMKEGDIVEQGEAEKIFEAPEHEYTRTLLDAAFNIAAEVVARGNGDRL